MELRDGKVVLETQYLADLKHSYIAKEFK